MGCTPSNRLNFIFGFYLCVPCLFHVWGVVCGAPLSCFRMGHSTLEKLEKRMMNEDLHLDSHDQQAAAKFVSTGNADRSGGYSGLGNYSSRDTVVADTLITAITKTAAVTAAVGDMDTVVVGRRGSHYKTQFVTIVT